MVGYSFDEEDIDNRFDHKLFDSLLNGVYDFYGVDNNCFCIGVNGSKMVLEAVENPSDGYRSYFECFKTLEVGKIFFKSPIAKVVLQHGGKSTRVYMGYDDDGNEIDDDRARIDAFSGWLLKDVNTDHIWLTVGTDYGEDYYPCFTFDYTPDKNQKLENDHEPSR